MPEFNITVAWQTTEIATNDFDVEAETLDLAKEKALEIAREHGVDGKSEIVDGEYFVTEVDGVRVPDKVEPPLAKDPVVRMIGALQWLLDDMHDAGETHDKETGQIFDSVEEAAAALVLNGGALSWYTHEQAKAYDARPKTDEAEATQQTVICEIIPDFDNTQADNEGWAIFGRDPGGPPFQLQKCDDSVAFKDDSEAWAFVVKKALEGSTYHQQALEYLKAYAPEEYRSIVSCCPYPTSNSEDGTNGTQDESGEAGGPAEALRGDSLGTSGEGPLQADRSEIDSAAAE